MGEEPIDSIRHRYCMIIKTGKACVFRLLVALAIACCWIGPSQALEPPTGEVLLKVSGEIEETNHNSEAWFDLKALKALGATEITTESPWTEGPGTFIGVRIKDLMDRLGASGKSFEAIARDKHKVSFADIDYEKYPIIIAWELNGEPLTIRTLGPLWIMFPYSEYPEIDIMANHNAAVWQLLQLKVD